MASQKQRQKNVNDTTDAWGKFVDLWRRTVPANRNSLQRAANLAAGKRGYG